MVIASACSLFHARRVFLFPAKRVFLFPAKRVFLFPAKRAKEQRRKEAGY